MAIFVSDSFTEGPGDPGLASHTGELGATWTDHPHANYTAIFTVDSATDRIYSLGTAAYTASGTPPSADYYAQADFYLITAVSQNVAVGVRMHATDDTLYYGRLNNGTEWQLFKRVAAASTQLGSNSTTNLPSAGGAPVTGRIVCQGDQISFIAGGATVIGPITDASITAAGSPCVRNAGAASASTGAHLDNFQAGTLDVPSVGHGSFVINSLRPAIFQPGRAR